MEARTTFAGVILALLASAPVQAQAIRELPGHHAPVYAVAFRPDGECMASASFDHTIKLWDVPAGAPVRTLTGHDAKVLTLAYTPDGRTLASAGLDGTIRLWDGATGRPRACLATREWCV